MLTKVYFKDDPETPVEMFEIDAKTAVAQHPSEWSFDPWKKASKASAKAAATVSYSSKDNGDGTFSIIDNAGAVAVKSISADDAKAFDDMSDADKAAYVKAETASS